MWTSFEKYRAEKLSVVGPKFCILASMRTGTNYLESLINSTEDMQCYGELFNKTHPRSPLKHRYYASQVMVDPKKPESITQNELDEVLSRVQTSCGQKSWGFRIFNDHNDLIYTSLIWSPGIHFLVLKRNLLESFVSLKNAQDSNQWRLTDMKFRKRVQKINVDVNEFLDYAFRNTLYYQGVIAELHAAGASFMIIDYSRLSDPQIQNEIASFVGSASIFDESKVETIKQNSNRLSDRVENLNCVISELQRKRVARWLF